MEKPTVGMTVRRSGARLRSMTKAHSPLHVLLWQAREAQSALLAAAAAQKTLFSDFAAWASTENRALSDVCGCVQELSSLYTAALAQLAIAYKAFRKEIGLILEGERRCDSGQRKLNDAEAKRIKLRRQVLRAQNRVQEQGSGQPGDFHALQTQLAEAERGAERAHMEASNTAREQESVKLVVVKAAISKLADSHLKLALQSKDVFEGVAEAANEVPDPPAPGDPVSCVRYQGYEATKGLVQRVKTQLGNLDGSGGSRSRSRLSSSRPVSTSTPLTSPNSSSLWSPNLTMSPSAPPGHEPPPPYNLDYLSGSRSREASLSNLSVDLNNLSDIHPLPSSSSTPSLSSSSLYPNISNSINLNREEKEN